MHTSPGRSTDALLDIEARQHQQRDGQRDLADAHPQRPIWAAERHDDLKRAVGHATVDHQDRDMDECQCQPDRGEILVQGERDRSMSDAVEDLGREQQPVDHRSGEREIRQQRTDPRHVPRQPIVLGAQPTTDRLHRRAARAGHDDGDDADEQSPAQRPGPCVHALVHLGQPPLGAHRSDELATLQQQERRMHPGLLEQPQAVVRTADDHGLGQ